MAISDAQIALFMQQYLLPFFRIGALFMAMPVIGTRIVPARARLLCAFLITLLVVPLLPPITAVASLSVITFLNVVKELLIGVAIGFSFQVAFQVFVLSGQFIAMKMGLGFASMNDPTNGVQTTVISQFYLMLITLMFIVMNGHLVLIEMLVSSFEVFVPGAVTISPSKYMDIVKLGSWLFASALVFSLPILTSLLFINIAFGVMSRAAPQLNIFAVGFPFTLASGMVLMYVGLTGLNSTFDTVMNEGFFFIKNLIEG